MSVTIIFVSEENLSDFAVTIGLSPVAKPLLMWPYKMDIVCFYAKLSFVLRHCLRE